MTKTLIWIFIFAALDVCAAAPAKGTRAVKFGLTPQTKLCGNPKQVLVIGNLNMPTWYLDVINQVTASYNDIMDKQVFSFSVAPLDREGVHNSVILIDVFDLEAEKKLSYTQGVVVNYLYAESGCVLGAKITFSNRYQYKHRHVLVSVLRSVLAAAVGLNIEF